MEDIQAEVDALRAAQPSWRADGLGVRGNPIEYHREQATVNWPAATVTERRGPITQVPAKPGAPEQPPSVPAT